MEIRHVSETYLHALLKEGMEGREGWVDFLPFLPFLPFHAKCKLIFSGIFHLFRDSTIFGLQFCNSVI
jgi:hypothetical protein